MRCSYTHSHPSYSIHMPNYDFDYFLSTVKHLDYKDVVLTVQQQLDKTPQNVKKGEAMEFKTRLSGLLYWLDTGKKNVHFPKFEFIKLRELCENLVAKKQLRASTLKVFSRTL